MSSGLILFAHGSRDPEWAAPFRDLQQRVCAKRTGLAVELAFLEIMKPSLPEAVAALLAAGREHITIAPLFMAQGAHLKRDLANLMGGLRESHPGIDLVLLPPLGESVPVVEAMSTWIAEHA